MSLRTHTHEGGAVLWWLIGVLAVAGLAVGLWIWSMLSWSYSSGERAGWVQMFSKKGYLCKTWEGEMAMVSLPGSVPEKFFFTVWDDQTAEKINQMMGRRVSLRYDEHILLPTSCFGETRHFVKEVKAIEDTPAPMNLPSVPGVSPAPVPQAPTTPAPPAQPQSGEQKAQ